jgi:hypothetical protein
VNEWHETSGEAKTFTTLTPSQSGGGESGGSPPAGPVTSTGPSLSPPPVVVLGELKILSIKVRGNGQVVLTLEAPAAGAIDARATASIRETAAESRKHKHVHKITYGTASAATPGADTITVTIKPSNSAFGALKSMGMLRVPVTVVFYPHDGSPTTVSQSVTVHYQPPRRSSPCPASNGPCHARR